jgi:hypothetical protein
MKSADVDIQGDFPEQAKSLDLSDGIIKDEIEAEEPFASS